jgi:MFS family permease
MAAVIASQMLTVAVGWQVYELTRRPLDLGFVGLAQFAPALGLSLVTGHVADRFDRRRIVTLCHLATASCAIALFFLARAHAGMGAIYALVVVLGVARAFSGPAGHALLPLLVPKEDFPGAVALSSSNFQIGLIAGPALGGILYGATKQAAPVYAVCAVLSLTASSLVFLTRARGTPDRKATSIESVLAGVTYVWKNKLLLGAVSLDLFAVLLGGAVALLPIFARDILKTGPWGLGILRSAPAVGAAIVGLVLARWPLRRKAGPAMLACVALFGAATVIFGLSKSFALSLAALLVLGASDMVSVFVRQVLVQLATPDEMRGRVAAVNLVFIGASNELGEFESGVTAAWLGVIPAVVVGGVGTMLVVTIWCLLFPDLRRADQLLR